MHSLHFLRVWSRDPLLVEKYIHISKKSTMITNIGMKYKLHQVLFNHQTSPNQPSSGLSLQQTLNLVHSPTAPRLLWNSRGSSKEHGSTNSSLLSEGGPKWRRNDVKDERQTRVSAWRCKPAFAQPSVLFLLHELSVLNSFPFFLLYFGFNWIMVWRCVFFVVLILWHVCVQGIVQLDYRKQIFYIFIRLWCQIQTHNRKLDLSAEFGWFWKRF